MQQQRVELAIYGRSGQHGFTIRWFDMLVGMEVGWVPVAGTTDAATGEQYTTNLT